ncbi:hypothetical protein [Paractinoplanes rishiriensis]|uniref:Uncharacterized protein n=1 Tax=Paractinoplanes rishiriensis TaxID=1050105 RepID=A0A919K782_9ACTN|nr:hypothetical protein [Actinoplanes rishiriensis]GIF02241.1 hypothetical protein Ari01nite_97050 [Actinoplanes rishiriensis]
MRQIDSDSATPPDEPTAPPALVRLVSDPDRFEFYIEVQPGFSEADYARVCAECERLGFVAFDFDETDLDECGAEEIEATLDGETTRVMLRPTDPAIKAFNPL